MVSHTSVLLNAFMSYACAAVGRKKKKGHGETVIPPRSLFDKSSILKGRREGKEQKKNFSLKQQAPFAKPLPTLSKPAVEAGQDNPEWLISEDWALLQACTSGSTHARVQTRVPTRTHMHARRLTCTRKHSDTHTHTRRLAHSIRNVTCPIFVCICVVLPAYFTPVTFNKLAAV